MEILGQRLQAIPDRLTSLLLYNLFAPLWKKFRSVALNSAGLVITATSGKKVPKTGATDWYGIAGGKLVTIAAGTDMPALSGTVVNATYNIFVFTVDSAGTTYSNMGTAGATLDAVKFPSLDPDQAVIGFIIICPAGTGNFEGGTTALDDGTVTPATVYVNPIGMFDPTAEL